MRHLLEELKESNKYYLHESGTVIVKFISGYRDYNCVEFLIEENRLEEIRYLPPGEWARIKYHYRQISPAEALQLGYVEEVDYFVKLRKFFSGLTLWKN